MFAAPRSHFCRSAGFFAAALLSVAPFLAARAAGQELPPLLTTFAHEQGFPLLQSLEPPLPEADSQNFGVAVDPRGQVFVANGGGILTFDGASWGHIPIGKARTAFAVGLDGAGRVAVGGVDDLGLLEVDDLGSLQFRSLIGQVPASLRPLGQILSIEPTDLGFLYLAERALFEWDGHRLALVRQLPEGRPLARIFAAGAAAPMMWTRDEGLLRFRGGQLEPWPGGELFRDRRVDALAPAEGGLLVSVRGEGLFLLDDGKAAPWAPLASEWAVKNRVYVGQRLPGGRFVLGSMLGGALLLAADGSIEQLIDTRYGLPDDFITGTAADGEGALWLALDSGLARVEISSPVTLFDRRSGLPGSVLSFVRHRGRLYAGTSAGLFAAIEGRAAGDPGSPSLHFGPVPALDAPVWSFEPLGDVLLAGAGFGIFELHPDGRVVLVPGTEEEVGYRFLRSPSDPGRIWVGTGEGLGVLRQGPAGIVYEGRVQGLAVGAVRSMVEKDGILWCSTELEGPIGIELDGFSLAAPRLRRLAGEPLPGLLLAASGDEILGSRVGMAIYRIDTVRRVAERIPELLALEGRNRVDSLETDPKGNLWIGTRPPTIVLRQGDGFATQPISLVGTTARSVAFTYPEEHGVTWIGTDRGLYRYAGDTTELRGSLPASGFALISTGEGQRLFGGALGAVPDPVELPARFRRLHLVLSPRSFRSDLRYETRLEPIDLEWSLPNDSPEVEITRLPDGDYTLFARTRGPNGEVGPEAAFQFTVDPKWTETPLAYALYLVLAALVASGWAGLRSHALHKRAAELEAKVNEQTATLRQTVSKLRRTQSELESANFRLEELSSLDALTGIANRRPLQAELERQWSWGHRNQQPLAFVMLDLDHFKLLNDTHGHTEGDVTLREVAQYLKSQLRRPGDLVARYGGEEFAVLLPQTPLDKAVEMADKLRRGIEALGLPQGLEGPRVTASFGVAARIPVHGENSQNLVDEADHALYQAKDQGRNRVCAAEPGRRA